MKQTLSSRFKSAWNVFINGERDRPVYDSSGISYYRPDRSVRKRGNERSIINSIYNRIAIDAAAITIQHVKLDDNGRFLSVVDSGLNRCFSLEASLDQTGRSFIQDAVQSMLDEGCVALLPTDTDDDPEEGMPGSFDVLSMRVGKIVKWYPEHVVVSAYNERVGKQQEVIVHKRMVAIIENPLYSVMNEPNSTLQRLIRKLNILDAIDEQSGSGKLDLIIQLPYVVKGQLRQQQAEERRQSIEKQLTGSKYGIAYIDGTEHITQLNRAVENNLMSQIEFLTRMLYSQLGITEDVMSGTADEKAMLNYFNRSIEPILSAIVDECKRKFLTQTARSQHQSILFFRDPFRLVPVIDLAEIADKMTRNEIMTSNELRQAIGMKPADDPKADLLINSNMPQSIDGIEAYSSYDEPILTREEFDQAMEDLDEIDRQLDELEASLDEDSELKHYASPYYDPVAASIYNHEYYMKHRELQGRRSTAGLNDEGKEAAWIVRNRINEERKSKVKDHKAQTNKEIGSSKNLRDSNISTYRTERDEAIEKERERVKADIENHKNSMQRRIDSLNALLKTMSKEDRAARKAEFKEEISALREENKQYRTKLQAQFKEYSGEVREKANERIKTERTRHNKTADSLRYEHKAERDRLKEYYDELYLQELDKIKAEPAFQKAVKAGKEATSRSSSSKSSGSSSSSSSKSSGSSGDSSTSTWNGAPIRRQRQWYPSASSGSGGSSSSRNTKKNTKKNK